MHVSKLLVLFTLCLANTAQSEYTATERAIELLKRHGINEWLNEHLLDEPCTQKFGIHDFIDAKNKTVYFHRVYSLLPVNSAQDTEKMVYHLHGTIRVSHPTVHPTCIKNAQDLDKAWITFEVFTAPDAMEMSKQDAMGHHNEVGHSLVDHEAHCTSHWLIVRKCGGDAGIPVSGERCTINMSAHKLIELLSKK